MYSCVMTINPDIAQEILELYWKKGRQRNWRQGKRIDIRRIIVYADCG